MTNSENLTVTELTKNIKTLLEKQFFSLRVQGEISNCKKGASGHLYFTLKDEWSSISCALFAKNHAALSQFPKDGDEIIVTGSINVYPPRGSYQIIVSKIEFLGEGNLLKKFLDLKDFYEKKGVFAKERKKPLPFFPRTIGVVTSPTGAVIQDILQVLKRRLGNFHLILNPTTVQGERAAKDIAKAIRLFNDLALVDVIIVGRGGGSLEDLWPFNEKEVIEAVYRSNIPIVSAVGHETDFSLCDFASDVRAPTPSAAAELISQTSADLLAFLKRAKKLMYHVTTSLLDREKTLIHRFARDPLIRSPFGFIQLKMQDLDEIKEQIEHHMHQCFDKSQSLLVYAKGRLNAINVQEQLTWKKNALRHVQKNMTVFSAFFQQLRQKMTNLKEKLHLVNPKNILQQGYAIVFDQQHVLSSKSLALKKKELKITFSDGSLIVQPLREDQND